MATNNKKDQPTVIEGEQKWEADYNKKFIKELDATGKIDWKKYQYNRNRFSPSGPALDLSKVKLLLVSTAGAYHKDSQEPFDAKNILGDYTLRRIPIDTDFNDLGIAHDHYDHKAIKADPQVLLPLNHLKDMVREGKLGSLATEWISFSGYQPNIIKVKKELAEKIMHIAKELEVQATLLVPA